MFRKSDFLVLSAAFLSPRDLNLVRDKGKAQR